MRSAVQIRVIPPQEELYTKSGLKIVDIAPQQAMKKPRDRSHEWLFDQPAKMSALEVEQLLNALAKFRRKEKPRSVDAMTNLLIGAKNEPYTIDREFKVVGNTSVQEPMWLARNDIENQLRKLELDGKRFRLVSTVIGKRPDDKLQVQLWQLKRSNQSAATSQPAKKHGIDEEQKTPVARCSHCHKRKPADELEKNHGGICDDCQLELDEIDE